ncbi:MAG: hypothetical protein WD749_07980 [Phycisphaerales bacterium]
MRANLLVAAAGVAAGLGAAGPAAAQFAPAWAWNRRDVFVTSTGAITTTRGYEFTVSEPITVTAIGVYDEETSFGSAGTAQSFPGLAQAHPVALWNMANTTTPLATAVVEAGLVTPLCQDGYRYAPITPTALAPGQTYVVSTFWPGDDGSGNFDPHPDIQSSAAPVMFDPRVNVIQYRYNLFGGPNQFPASSGGPGNSFIGMLNFRIGAGACEPNPPADLATTFRAGTGQAGNMFDLTALGGAPQGLTVDGWQINLGNDTTNATPVEVSVYWREGTFVGSESTAAGWNLLGTVNVLSWGPNKPTPLPVGGLVIPAGATRGVFITTNFITSQPPPASPAFLQYSNIPPGLGAYENTDLRITMGVGKANPRFTGATFAAKAWNGGIRYTLGTGPAPCYANCDGSTTAPVLNVADFGCFLTRYAAGEAYANCDGSTTPPALNVADFGCFLTKYAAGCP